MKEKSNRPTNGPTRPVRQGSGEPSPHNRSLTSFPSPGTPAEEQRQRVKAQIVEAVKTWLESRIDEVFEMADEDGELEFGARITWRDINELRSQICGCLAQDLDLELGDQVEEIMEEELSRSTKRMDDGAATVKPTETGSSQHRQGSEPGKKE